MTMEKALSAETEMNERPKGKWIDKDGWLHCSNCGKNATPQNNGCEIEPCHTPFCPWCGADMRATAVLVEKLPDVAGKIYIVPREILNEYGEVKETVYEEWIFTADKIGEVSSDEYTEYDEWWEIEPRDKSECRETLSGADTRGDKE